MTKDMVKKEEHAQTRVWRPSADILEKTDGFMIHMDIPGVSEDGVEVDLDANELSVRAEVTISEGDDDMRLLTHEFGSGVYERRFTLGSMIERGEIKATVKDGVLGLWLPKAKEVQPRRIEVKAG